MAVALNPRAERLLARLPRLTVYSAGELLLLVLVAVQAARLFWAILTPLGPVGEYRALNTAIPLQQSVGTLTTFDPFFRQTAGAAVAPLTVTALDIRLYGTLEDRATGRGSAIIGTPDGRQMSYRVGEEIMPGVVLSAVAFDHVTITRGGAAEQLFLDQSPAPQGPAGPGSPTAPQNPMTAPAQPVPVVRAPPPAAPPPPAMQPSNTTQPMRVNQ
ncbi:MAG: type II secretion system protein N [Allosphingosinicella sp.]|uniref:type II secretion system protein N n=1 Tax=Allosphingosinicella sp. TaxID=2823234 RepID=UPI00392028E5